MIQAMTFTVVITDSYDLILHLGGEAWMSGLLIGIYFVSQTIANILTWVWMRSNPELWRTGTKSIILAGAGIYTCGAMLYASVAIVVDTVELQEDSLVHWLGLLILSRMLQGVGGGFAPFLFKHLIVHALEPARRPMALTNMQFCAMLAVGIGPIVSAAAHVSCF